MNKARNVWKPLIRVRRGIRRHVYPLLAAIVLVTILLLQYRASLRPPEAPVVFSSLPEYASQPVILSAGNTTVGQYIKTLQDQSHIPIDIIWPTPQFDMPALISATSMTVRGPTRCTLAEALLVLREETQHIIIPSFEADRVVVGSPDVINSNARAITIVYPIADLLTVGNPRVDGATPEQRIHDIAELIQSVVQPYAWRDMGGGVGELRELDAKLIITATPSMHYQIRQLLASLRVR